MAKIQYLQLRDGDRVEVDLGEKFHFACCDCGLVHIMVIAKEKNGKIGMAIKRNIAATSARRKELHG